jgi:hypothetical protein
MSVLLKKSETKLGKTEPWKAKHGPKPYFGSSPVFIEV